MWGWTILLAVVGCTAGTATSGDGPETTPNLVPPIETDPSPRPPVASRPDPPPPPPGPCDPVEGLEVVSLLATAGDPDTMVELGVTLTSPAAVAAACISDTEPDQIFFAESTVTTDVHTLRLSGLLPASTYTCAAAPTCPTQLGPAATTVWITSPPPEDVHPFTVLVNPLLGMTGSWTLASHALGLFADPDYLVIWGPDGRPRWWVLLPEGIRMSIEALYHTEDDVIVWGGGANPEGRIRIHDPWDGEQYAWAPEGWEETTFHHDAKRIADGRLMTLEDQQNTDGADAWEGFRIRVHDPLTGVVDFDFASQTLVDEGILPPPDITTDNDPYHANWMDWHEHAEGPRVYVSLCYSEQLLALDPTTGDVVWLLGEGLGWTVLGESGGDIGEEALPDCTHGNVVLGDDHLLVYDNGLYETSSHAQEWVVDADAMTVQRLWSWTEPGWSQWYLGDIDDLGNGRVLITKAPGPLVEVDKATGIVASRMELPIGDTYRSERLMGCDLFTAVKECPDLALRYEEVSALLE